MATLWNRAGHYIFVLWLILLSSSIFLSSPNPSGRTRLAGNAGRKKSPKNRHLGTIAQLCRAISSQLRHLLTIGKIC